MHLKVHQPMQNYSSFYPVSQSKYIIKIWNGVRSCLQAEVFLVPFQFFRKTPAITHLFWFTCMPSLDFQYSWRIGSNSVPYYLHTQLVFGWSASTDEILLDQTKMFKLETHSVRLRVVGNWYMKKCRIKPK